MTKKRKTLKQKKQSDLRHNPLPSPKIAASEEESIPESEKPSRYQYSFSTSTKSMNPTPAATTTLPVSNYSYLSKDLLRTAIVTSSIIIIELILAQVLNRV